ncbi:hypothetical protein NT01EI_0040 [Edwardsiella ictaluri 93-146]|uniref:Uncharacterized protein n=1 Tax=Edwardsiella ictaluri (strain 93-146) TaxID=634503 RepID=C5B9C0_EDWI9|nr:hypothetical protein NT01EI_0040 [Edwardsiella ictaluri 93-146]
MAPDISAQPFLKLAWKNKDVFIIHKIYLYKSKKTGKDTWFFPCAP